MAKMNNFTATESLPKTGHVNEVCKEWLVREDGALAYKLQSQEINDFYKGNRFRNAVVREDFPTALQEQIKEKETADKQTEAYRRKLREQEEHDKRVAREISEKLEKDLKEQKENEKHLQMQDIYVNIPPLPPPKHQVPPPRPAKSSTLQQQQQQQQQQQKHTNDSTSPNNQHSSSQRNYSRSLSQPQQATHPSSQIQFQQTQYPLVLQQHHFSSSGGYVDLSLQANPLASSRERPAKTSEHRPQNYQLVGGNTPATLTQSLPSPQTQIQSSLAAQRQQHQLSSSLISAGGFVAGALPSPIHSSVTPANATAAAAATKRSFINTNSNIISTSPNAQLLLTPTSKTSARSLLQTQSTTPPSPQSTAIPLATHDDIEQLIEYTDVIDQIRSYGLVDSTNCTSSTNITPSTSSLATSNHYLPQHKFANLPLTTGKMNRFTSPSNENLLKNEQKLQKLSADKYDQMIGNRPPYISTTPTNTTPEHCKQQQADDIELYTEPCDYEANLKEIGLPMHEIKEINEKLKQEQKDELLARRLQELEVYDGVGQEERDRMLAIEAQDKELAKMLQEREKAKVKRAKEKARQRKHQQKDNSISVHNGPLQELPLEETNAGSPQSPLTRQQSYTDDGYADERASNAIDLEAYSSPIDVIKHQQRSQNGCLTNGSLNRELVSQQARHASLHRDDDIYTLPVDSCNPAASPTSASPQPSNQINQVLASSNSCMRPLSMNITADNAALSYTQNSMTRSENFSVHSHDSSIASSNCRLSNYTKTTSFDQSPSPTPPYMPIQGTRRSNSSEERKKKSKDNKCTHQ